MPAHFGKYNYAICRRLSRSALMRRAAQQQQQQQHDNGRDTNGNSTTPTNGGDKAAKNKNKKKDKRNKSPNGDSIEFDDLDKSNTNETNGNGTQSNWSDADYSIDYEKANEELNNFIATLRMLNIDVIELCPDDELEYESVFIGDTAVTVNGLVLLCRPRNRLNEINEIKQIIKSELNLPIIEIKDESALLNGGDVLWTGREIFVGLSTETNEAGARAVAAAFPEYSVTPVKVPNVSSNGNKSSAESSKKRQTTNEITTGLMLKSFITMAGPDILCINRSQEAGSMLRRMEREASYNYKLITLDDEQASNVLYLNGTLIHRNDLPESVSILQEKIDYSRVPVKISELTRNNPYHGLDSLCLLVRKSHRIQTIV